MVTAVQHIASSSNTSPGLKWKVLLALSLVLLSINGGMAYLVYLKSTAQFDAEQARKREVHVREFEAAFSRAVDSLSTFAYFIPKLADQTAHGERSELNFQLAEALRQHGLMLNVEWGVEGVHYFDGSNSPAARFSWPEARKFPEVDELVGETVRDDAVLSRLVCDLDCVQLVAMPFLDHGKTVGALIVERAIGDTLKAFHLLSGMDVVVLHGPRGLAADALLAGTVSSNVVSVTREAVVLPVMDALSRDIKSGDFLRYPHRVRVGQHWYEVFVVTAVPVAEEVAVLLVDRVTENVTAVGDAISDSIVLGAAGLAVSELILLVLLWEPMRRLQEVIYALPLLSEKSFAQLRDVLPELPRDAVPRDEIDEMIGAIGQVAERIEALDETKRTAEDALRKSETRLQFAQSLARVVSWTGQPLDGTFAFGEGVRRISRVLPHVSKWSEFMAFVHPEDRVDVLKAWRSGRPGSAMDVEFRLLINGQQIDMHAMARFDAVGPTRILRAAGMMQDVSEMRSIQRALQDQRDRLEDEVAQRTRQLAAERNKAEQLAESKSRFLANMSHEIRTPLNAVLGLSQVGRQQSENRKIATTFEQILTAGDHLLDVVNDVLDLSKLEAGKLVIASEPYELELVVRRCRDMFEQRAQAEGLQLAFSIADELPGVVVGDRFRVQQILVNLIGNALKFTERGRVGLEVYADSGRLCFRVTDTGIGMTSAQLQQLFKPFYQVSGHGPEFREGTGLGLAISNRMAGIMGGDIGVRSTLEKGSEFVLSLPLIAAPDTAVDKGHALLATPIAAKQLDGLRVLVADDMSINRKVVEHLLSSEGAIVETAVDGSEAVAALASGVEFDLVLMDVQMPGMDGRAATRRIRRAGIDVPIIGVTAHSCADEQEASVVAGMQGQLVKPLIQETLVNTILMHVGRKRSTGAPGGTTVH